jgi:hypothetical protein
MNSLVLLYVTDTLGSSWIVSILYTQHAASNCVRALPVKPPTIVLFPSALSETIERSTRRRKCIIPRKGSHCQFCVSRSLHCDLATGEGVNHQYPYARQTSNVLDSSPESHTNERSGGGLGVFNKALCNELINLYFDLIHDKQHILFHKPTFIADQMKGQAPMILVYAIMALAARYVDYARRITPSN